MVGWQDSTFSGCKTDFFPSNMGIGQPQGRMPRFAFMREHIGRKISVFWRQVVKQALFGLIIFFLITGIVAGEAKKGKKDKKGEKGDTAAVAQTAPPSGHSTEASNEFIIGPEDSLSINVWKEPELSTSVIVRSDGKISLPLINEIQASGMTTKQLQDHIAERLKDFVASPVVTVMVKEIRSQSVTVLGEVTRPGVYPFGSPMSVTELIGRAGGFQAYAKKNKIRILRNENGHQIQFPFNFKDFIKGKNPGQNISLKNGDTVIVP